MNARELIIALSYWDLSEDFDVHVLNNPHGKNKPVVILTQGNNSINLSNAKD